jgi:four helix bundle protein
MEKLNNFKQLKIWQKGMEVVKETYKLTLQFPKEELYGLSSQIRRAATSIPLNIAEGFKRFHNAEYKQFLRISLGSAAELETALLIAINLNYLKNENIENTLQKLEELSKMTGKLIRCLNA